MGWLGSVVKFFKNALSFEKESLSYIVKLVKEDPERIFIGAIDPFSSKVWGTLLGKDYEPLINQMGGPTQANFENAAAKGVDIGPASALHTAASMIASFYAGGYGMSQLGAGGAAVGGPNLGPGLEAVTSTSAIDQAIAATGKSGFSAAAMGGFAPMMGSTNTPTAPGGTTSPGTATGFKGLLKNVGNWIKDNQVLVGTAVSGIGQGLMSAQEGAADRDLVRERWDHYKGTDPGSNYQSLSAPTQSGRGPSEAISDRLSREYGGYEYQYDPAQGRIVRVPTSQG